MIFVLELFFLRGPITATDLRLRDATTSFSATALQCFNFFTFCRRPERQGKIIVVGVTTCRRLQDIVVVDVCVFVVVSGLVVATSVAGVVMVCVEFVTSIARFALVAIIVSTFFMIVFFSTTSCPAPFHACCLRVASRNCLHHLGLRVLVYCCVGRVHCVPIYRRRHGVDRRCIDCRCLGNVIGSRRIARACARMPRDECDSSGAPCVSHACCWRVSSWRGFKFV